MAKSSDEALWGPTFNLPGLRLGSNSCMFEASLLDNVRRSASFFADVELILYEHNGEDNYPKAEELAALKDLAAEHNLSFTVHLPAALGTSDGSLQWRENTLRSWERAVKVTEALKPLAYVWHWEAEQWGVRPSEIPEQWQERTWRMADTFLQTSLLPSQKLCVETLGYDFGWIWEAVCKLHLNVTLDIGHLWRAAMDTPALLDELLPRAKVVHLHGVKMPEGSDHCSLNCLEPPKLAAFMERLQGQYQEDALTRVLTLEVFSLEDMASSVACLRPFAS